MEPYLPLNASDEMRTTDNGKAILRRAFKHLERELPERVAWSIRNQRTLMRTGCEFRLVCSSFWAGGSFLGIWILPLGLLLIAHDVPVLRGLLVASRSGAPGDGRLFDNGSPESSEVVLIISSFIGSSADTLFLRHNAKRQRSQHGNCCFTSTLL